MGDHGDLPQPSGLLPNGLLPNEVACVTQVLDAERWSKAEERTAELIDCIQPNRPSEECRNAVANYVQRLITKCFSCQVFTFGSVPLKTYLPDGDIDLTAFSKDESLKDTWANEVREVLENEEKNENAEFRVKEVQYIQAEVKIIKCLVEGIVVDISFNQLGGLCTLCFLEQIDHIINHDHLFKRSIILIKAWCYYESRILGAHHGLISTYALETLVLYIFHVFNNSFAGPLEVLYRFLEFFSNFDWDNFCVSLWGPVPISSLPDMAAEPPRKDGGELLLSKVFLDMCSTVYAIMPVGQPFVSKHFNVIDPLRINNNLGRSVSKGNFFRIRSAFAFGAKKLARLLECPKENLIGEVNQFFMNTWERHGSGNRPDAPSPNSWHLRPLKTVPYEESNSSRITSSTKKKNENVVLPATHDCLTDGALPFSDNFSQIQKTINQHSRNIHRTSMTSAISRTQSQKSYGMQNSCRFSDHIEKNNGSRESAQAEKSQKPLKPDHYVNYQGVPGRFHFARTRSSPELTDTSEVLSRGSRNKVPETGNNLIATARLDHGSRRKYSGFDVSRSRYAKSFDDPSSSRHCSSQQSLEAADSNNVSDTYHDDVGFANIGEEHSSVSEALEMQQEEQDLVNMMASSTVHNLIGQVQMPIHFGSHLPFPLPSSLLASMDYRQRNLAGSVHTSFPVIESPQSSDMLFPQGLVSSPLSPYFLTTGFNLNSEYVVDPTNGSCGMTEMNPEESGGYLHEDDPRSDQGFDPENGDFQVLRSDDKQQEILGGFNYASSSQASNSGPFISGHHKFARESSVASEEHTGAFQNQTGRGNDTYSSDRNGYMRYIPASQASPSSSKSASESSFDGSAKASKSSRDKRGRRTASPAISTSLYRESKIEWQQECSSDHSSAQADDEASPHARPHQLSGYEPAQISGSDSVIPVAPMIVNGSGQRVMDNSGVVPFTFPLVPFLAMFPVYNMPPATGSSDGLINQFVRDERLDHGRINPCDQNHDSAENLDQSESHVSSSAFRSADPEPPEEHKSDILNGDFLSHLQNLQYGWSCQNTRYHGPFMYQSPVMVPPIYLQGHFPWDGPGRSLTANANIVTQIMSYGPCLVPVAPIQPGPHRTSGVLQRFGDEVPRYRGGTGTYLPNPKVSFRDRQSSTRNHRGNYNYDRNDNADREGSWIYAKSRAANRRHGRTQAEKLSLRPDQLSTTDNRIDRPWDPHRHEPLASSQAQDRSFGLANTSHNLPN